MLSLYVSKLVVREDETNYFSVSILAAKTQEEAERDAIYRTAKEYPNGAVRLLGSSRVDDYLIDLVRLSRN